MNSDYDKCVNIYFVFSKIYEQFIDEMSMSVRFVISRPLIDKLLNNKLLTVFEYAEKNLVLCMHDLIYAYYD